MPDEIVTPSSTPTPPPAPATPPANNGDNGGDDEKPIMNSAQLKERLERDREAQRKKFLAEYGIEDPEADKSLLAEARKRKADELTEAQKATAELAKEKTKREAAEQALATRNAEIDAEKRTATRDSAVKDALAKANAKPDKVLKLLRADHADLLDAVLKEDGTVDDKAVVKVIDAARKDYAEDFGKGGVGSPSNSGGKTPSREVPKVKTSGRL